MKNSSVKQNNRSDILSVIMARQPVSRKQVVLCKYALGGACTLASVLVALAVEGIAAGATGSPWGGDALLSGAYKGLVSTMQQQGANPANPPAGTPAKRYTTEELRSMSAAEINANWDAIKASIGQKGE